MARFGLRARSTFLSALFGIVGLLSMASTANAANMLIFGDRPGDQTNLEAQLTSLGHTVTNTTAMPASLTGYAVVWQVEVFSALTPAEQTLITNYLQGGGSVYFTGERPCCDAANGTIQNVLRAVVAGGASIQVGNLGDINCPCTFNPAAVGGISTTPNTLNVWTPSASGGMANIAAPNIFATGAGAVPVGAAFAPSDMTSGRGRAVVLMDVNYLSGDPDLAHEIANITNFLLAGGGAAPVATPVPALGTWMLLALALMLVGTAYWLRRRAA
jgi:hypothetical protein